MSKPLLHNKLNRAEAEKILAVEKFNRLVISFYRYVEIENAKVLRDLLFEEWSKLNVLGRVYLASEGINAQVSIPEPLLNSFRDLVDSVDLLKGVAKHYTIKRLIFEFK